MTVLINRFNILSEAIEKSADRKRIKREVERRMTPFARDLIRRLRALTPDGSVWNDPAHVFQARQIFPAMRSERPSLRQHGITMLAGWNEPIIDYKGSTKNIVRASMTLVNTAPQSKWVIDGTSGDNVITPNSLSEGAYLWFYHFRENVDRKAVAIVHKGISPYLQLQNVLNNASVEASDQFDNLRGDFFRPLRDLR